MLVFEWKVIIPYLTSENITFFNSDFKVLIRNLLLGTGRNVIDSITYLRILELISVTFRPEIELLDHIF